MKKPLLSIVVPTKDRYEYLINLIELLNSFNDSSFEMVIQDNSTDNSPIINYLEQHNLPFVKYYYLDEPIPMSTNSDRAILNSKGDYICFIGDDDGVTPLIVDVVKWMKANSIEAVSCRKPIYFWPDVNNSYGVSYAGELTTFEYTGEITKLSAYDSLIEVIQQGCLTTGRLPMLYNGIVKREVLDKVYAIGGTFFPGSSPDISNGVCLSLLVGVYYFIDLPIVIIGSSKYRGGGMNMTNNRYPKLEDIPWLLPNAIKNWDKRLPHLGVVMSIWPDSAIKGLEYMNRVDLVYRIDFEYIYSRFVAYNFPIRKYAYNLSQHKFKLFFISSSLMILRLYSAFLRLIKNKFFHSKVINGRIELSNIVTIKDAVQEVMQLLSPSILKKIC